MAMLHPAEVDHLFPVAAFYALAVFLVLVSIVYSVTPAEDLVLLEGIEHDAPFSASIFLVTGLIFFCLPFITFFRAGQTVKTPSGIVAAAVVVGLVALATNLLLSLFPTVVWVDPVTKARVFAVRWCEWIPLSGLMTFMSDAVDAPKRKGGLRPAIIHSFSQITATTCGIVFPFCPDTFSWVVVQIISTVAYLPIFPRVWMKQRALEQTTKEVPYRAQEDYHRRYFAYHLLRTCSFVWTALVTMYYVHAVWFFYFPKGHPLRVEGSAMVVDTMFDVLAKCFYLRVIVEVHYNVFDSDARRQRQLHELRRLMQVLWDSTTDAILISVQDKERTASFLSPSFQDLIGTSRVKPAAPSSGSAGIMLETATSTSGDLQAEEIFDARYIDSSHVASTDALESLTIESIELKSDKVRLASELIQACWSRLGDECSEAASIVLFHEFTKLNGERSFCEMKVCRKSSESFVAIVRDVTERQLRFEAEQRARAETLARQKDAQTVNRFTRHEIKNGLLCGIELCDGIQESLENASKTIERSPPAARAVEHELTKMTGTFGEIDRVLHEILDTVLAEAMARDVIHECYQAVPKKTDVLTTLNVSDASTERFALVVASEHCFPDLMLDTQLLRYIHRNAISNACKYGLVGGVVTTNVSYDTEESLLTVAVVNRPGPGHEKLLQMGEEACTAVFESGKRLHNDLNLCDGSELSSGDGAWIMQKCAKNMQGSCSIAFEKDQTVFKFTCKAVPVDADEQSDEEFELPLNTWALGIDDSWIQRKLLLRIFANAGVHLQRKKVIGRDIAELDLTEGIINEVLDSSPQAKVLVLVDENLDYNVEGEGRIIRSGSRMMEAILRRLPPNRRDRMLVLVRSANDSSADIAIYNERTHGFFAKTATRTEQILGMLKPCWMARFGSRPSLASEYLGPDDADLENDDISKEDLRDVLESVESLFKGGKSFRDVPWPHLWSTLHGLKGDIMVSENEALQEAAEEINSLRGAQAPEDFEERWAAIRQAIVDAIDAMN